MMEGWKTDKIENIFFLGRGRVINDEEIKDHPGIYPVFSSQTSNNGEFGKVDFYEFEGEYITWTTDGANAGKVFYRSGKFNCTNVCGTLKPKHPQETNVKYFAYLIDRHAFRHVAVVGNNKLMNNVMGKIKITFPADVNQQSAIAAMLSKVDEAIAAVQGSISAAERLKKSLMQNLLTGCMKPDGTLRKEDEFYADEKFGRVPVGWEVKKVKDLFYMNQNTLSSNTNADYRFKYITIEAVNTEKIEFENCPCYSFKDSPGRARRIIKDNDILISGVRPNLKAFAIYYKPDSNNWICSTGFHVLTAKEKVCPQFFFYQILSSIGASQFHSWVAGSNYPAIGDSDMKNMLLYTPPYEEQLVINQKFESISKSQKEKQSKIAVLERLKKSLMQNLLTGKVRIRH